MLLPFFLCMQERNNLATDPKYSTLIESLKAKLKEKADAGPNIAIAFDGVGLVNKTADSELCNQQEKFGYLLPLDWKKRKED